MKSRKMGVFGILLTVMLMVVFTSCVLKNDVEPPTAPVNIYPAQSELVNENYFYAKWEPSRDPDGGSIIYRINYGRSAGSLDDEKFFVTNQTYFLFPNLEEGIWYWQVTASDEDGQATKSPIWNFTVNGEALPQPADISELPPDPALLVTKIQNNSFTLNWPEYVDRQNPLNAIVYTLYLFEAENGISYRAIKDNGESILSRAAVSAETTDINYTFSNLKSSTVYEWTIIANIQDEATSIMSRSSGSRTSVVGSSQTMTGNREPSIPLLQTPADGATGYDTDAVLSWEESIDPDGDEVKYFVYFDSVSSSNKLASSAEGIIDTRFSPEGLVNGRTYYWSVMAKDSNGAATRTEQRNFSTYTPSLEFPHTPNPTDSTENINPTENVLLAWQQDQAGKPVRYTLYFSSNPKNMEIKAGGLTDKQYTITDYLDSLTWYYWQIESLDLSTNETVKGPTWKFKTAMITSPEQIDATTNLSGSQIELTYDKEMKDPTGKCGSYTVKRNTVTTTGERAIEEIEVLTIERKTNTMDTYVLTLDHNIMFGDVVTVSYTRGTIQSVDGGFLENINDATVNNIVPVIDPLQTGATTDETGLNIELTYDKNMTEPSGNHDAYTVKRISKDTTGKRIIQIIPATSVNLKDGALNTYVLTLEDAIKYEDVVSVSYKPGTVSSEEGGILRAFDNATVTNIVPIEKPVLMEAETHEDGMAIMMAYSKEMADPTGQHETFTIKRKAAAISSRGIELIATTGISFMEGASNTFILTLEEPLFNGDTITISYEQGSVQSAEGGLLQDFDDATVTNNVPVIVPVLEQAMTNATGSTIELTFSKDMAEPAGENDAFTVRREAGASMLSRAVTIIGTTQIALKPGATDTYILTLEDLVDKGDNLTVSYIPGSVQSADGGILTAFTNATVTNMVQGENPSIASATMQDDGLTINLLCTHHMADPSESKADFNVLVNGFVNTILTATLDASDSRIIVLNLEREVARGNNVHVSFNEGTVTSVEGRLLEQLMDMTVDMSGITKILVSKNIQWNFNKIQDAINSEIVVNGDTITVATGTYNENINFGNKRIVLKSTYETNFDAIEETIINGQANGLSVVTLGTAVASGLRNRIGDLATIEGFTVRNAGTYGTSAIPAGIHVIGDAIIRENAIIENGTETTGINAYGILVDNASPEIYGNYIIKNYNGVTEGAAVRIEGAESKPKIYQNMISFNEASRGAGIFIADNAKLVNAAGEDWRDFNSPNAEITYVENTIEASANIYNSNSNGALEGAARSVPNEGIDICYEATQTTDEGSLSISVEDQMELSQIQMDIHYTIGMEFHGGSVTIDVPIGFEITTDASIVIDGESTEVTNYSYDSQSITVSGLTLTEGTVTLKLEPQETPQGKVVAMSGRNIDYIFSANGDADGSDTYWQPSVSSDATFVANDLSRNTNFILTGDNTQYVKLEVESDDLRVASQTLVQMVFDAITSEDGSAQTYTIKNQGGDMSTDTAITADATLVVASEYGNTENYAVRVIMGSFVRLEQPESGAITWYETINAAIDAATADATVTLWEGHYKETIELDKNILLTTATPTDETLRNNVIVDSQQATNAITIKSGTAPVIKGLSITNNNYLNTNIYMAGIYVEASASPVIVGNRIMRNNYGIMVTAAQAEDADEVYIENNLIENNNGNLCGGVYVSGNRVARIITNTFRNNNASSAQNPGAGGISVADGGRVKNTNGEFWTPHVLPGTTVDASEIEGVSEVNTYIGNTVNGNEQADGADVKFPRTPGLSTENTIIYDLHGEGYSGGIVLIYGSYGEGTVARLYTSSTAVTEVASSTGGITTSARMLNAETFNALDEEGIVIEYDGIQAGEIYYLTLQSTPTAYTESEKLAKTAEAPVNMPALLNPTAGATEVAVDLTLNWSSVAKAVEYRIYIEQKVDEDLPTLVATTSSLTFYATTLNHNKEYVWTVGAVDKYGLENISTPSTFVTDIAPFDGGDGSVGNPFIVSNWKGLATIGTADYLQKGYYFVQATDLTTDSLYYDRYASTTANNGLGWDPIGGGEGQEFTGFYIGMGYKIENLNINRPDDYSVGLFGNIKQGGIASVGLENASITGYEDVGGIVGYTYESTITKCYVTGTIIAEDYMGGIAGTSEGLIEKCYSRVSLTTTYEDAYVGGIVGEYDGATVTVCFATGYIDAPVLADTGGIIGYDDSSEGTVTSCYWDTNTTGQATDAILNETLYGTSTSNMKLEETYKGWDFVNDWAIDGSQIINDGYPYLKPIS